MHDYACKLFLHVSIANENKSIEKEKKKIKLKTKTQKTKQNKQTFCLFTSIFPMNISEHKKLKYAIFPLVSCILHYHQLSIKYTQSTLKQYINTY